MAQGQTRCEQNPPPPPPHPRPQPSLDRVKLSYRPADREISAFSSLEPRSSATKVDSLRWPKGSRMKSYQLDFYLTGE